MVVYIILKSEKKVGEHAKYFVPLLHKIILVPRCAAKKKMRNASLLNKGLVSRPVVLTPFLALMLILLNFTSPS